MFRKIIAVIAFSCGVISVAAQGLPTDAPLTIRPLVQQLGETLLKGKQGSIVATSHICGCRARVLHRYLSRINRPKEHRQDAHQGET